MSPLRKFLKHPATYLVLLILLAACVLLDGLRFPQAQLTARMYVTAVRGYQAIGHPLLDGRVRCRFRPTCSNYSIAAVQKFGFLRGISLTAKRLVRCRSTVPLDTFDPLP